MIKETILRKSEYQQKELKFKKSSLSINVQNLPFSLEFLDIVSLHTHQIKNFGAESPSENCSAEKRL